MLENITNVIGRIGYRAYNENDEIPPPNQVTLDTIMIFDDVSLERQHNIQIIYNGKTYQGDVQSDVETIGT